jgi:hypothetical protein
MIHGMRRTTSLALGLAAVVVVSFGALTACGSFDGTTAEEHDAGLEAGADAPPGVEGGEPDVLAPDGGGGPDGSSPTAPLCPPPVGPVCALATCSRRILYVPDAPSWPFAVVTDSAFVYWLEQRGVDAYNGNGVARVMRVDRVGSPTPNRAKALVADQALPTALALVGGYLYWATWDAPNAMSTLRRVSASCAPPCQEESLGTVSNRIQKLVGLEGTGVIAMVYDGTIVRFSVGADGGVSAGISLMTSAKFPGLTATGTHLYASGLLVNKVSRAEILTGQISPAWATLALDAGTDVGLTNLATNCVDLFGFHANGELERINLGTSAVSHVASLGVSVYSVAQDARYLYVASLNNGGVIAVDPATQGATTIASGSFESIAADSAGVYWADHPNPGGGTVTMLVK